MSDNKPIKIFVSHNHADSSFTDKLVADLRSDLLDDTAVWVNDIPIAAGAETSWQDTIAREMSERQVFLVVLSTAALLSEHVKWELALALRQRLTVESKIIIGAQYQACDIPPSLADAPIVPFLPTSNYGASLAQLQGVLLNAVAGKQRTATEPLLDGADRSRFLGERQARQEGQTASGHVGENALALLDLVSPTVLMRLRWRTPTRDIGENARHVIFTYLNGLGSRVESQVETWQDSAVVGAVDLTVVHSTPGEPERGAAHRAPDASSAGEPAPSFALFAGLALDSILSSPNKPAWRGEMAPLTSDIDVMRRSWEDLQAGRPDDACGRLTSITDVAFDGRPSFAMRWHYYLALAHWLLAERANDSDMREALASARDELKVALSLALGGQDAASEVIIKTMLGEVYHDLSAYDLALSEYQTALATLRQYGPGGERACALAGVRLRIRIARQLYLLGNYASALDHIQAAREIGRSAGGPAISQSVRASDEWLEALILRAVSQIRGGDVHKLRVALKLFKAAEKRLAGGEEHVSDRPRLRIQIAETHLDLAELSRARGLWAAYRKEMDAARRYAMRAADAFRTSGDAAGRAWASLTLVRYDFLDPRAYKRMIRHNGEGKREDRWNEPMEHALAPRIYDVEKAAADSGDLALLGRAATLRADVLTSLGDFTSARAVYYVALEAFERAGAVGEAARAIFGVRHAQGTM